MKTKYRLGFIYVISSVMNAFLFMGSFHKMNISHGFLCNNSLTCSSTSKKSPYNGRKKTSIFAIEKSDDIDDKANEKETFNILEVDMKDSFSCPNFAATNCWGVRPLLMRGAFHTHSKLFLDNNLNDDDDNDVKNEDVSQWPTWDEVMELALDEDAESRLITHVPDDARSWRLTLGPFEENELDDLSRYEDINDDNHRSRRISLLQPHENWTMIINDVDRFHPPLFDFITETFSFIPQWRKDDGQSKNDFIYLLLKEP
jgi:hypothetical protein